MKPRKGTPIKIPNVVKLRKLFENSTSLPTRGHAELLPQLCRGLNFTNPNLSTTTGVQDWV